MNKPAKFSDSRASANAASLEREIDWCTAVMDARFSIQFAPDSAEITSIEMITPPDLTTDPSEYAKLVKTYEMGFFERIILIMALIPHVRPEAFDLFTHQNEVTARPYSQFGGIQGKVHRGFLPTLETAAFVLAGTDLSARMKVTAIFDESHYLRKQAIIKIDHPGGQEPFFASALGISSEYLYRCTSGNYHKPDFAADFPAKLITTRLTWDDVVLSPDVREEIERIKVWMTHAEGLMAEWGLDRQVKPGFRCLFYGPPGTGKTLTATLLGTVTGVDVYRIDLSMVVSKYIGETEKNLASVFDQAQTKNWILFFDEADALFGKRTQNSSANDQHANQQVAYLLQRIEDFPGMVILATNLQGNMDEAFMRRFQASLYFPLPDIDQRLELWKKLFPDGSRLAKDVDFEEFAEQYEMAGGALLNAARYAVIRAVRNGRTVVNAEDLREGIRKELQKEGKTL